MKESMNFTYTVRKPKDGTYGTPKPSGWTGMIGDLTTKEADIGNNLCNISIIKIIAYASV